VGLSESEVWHRSDPTRSLQHPKAKQAIRHCNRCRWLKLGHKWQQKLLYADVGGSQATWLKEGCSGPWGLQCKVCRAAAENPDQHHSPYITGLKGARQSEVPWKAFGSAF